MKRKYLWMVRRAYRALRHPRLRRQEWWKKLTQPLMKKELWKPCRDTVATGLAIGLFFSVMPLPLQTIFAGTLAMWFRANVPIAIAATWLSNPLTNVPIWAMQLFIGKWIQEHIALSGLEIPSMGGEHVVHFLIGAGVSGLLLGMLAFPLVHLFSAVMPHHLPRLPKRKGVRIIPAVVRRSSES